MASPYAAEVLGRLKERSEEVNICVHPMAPTALLSTCCLLHDTPYFMAPGHPDDPGRNAAFRIRLGRTLGCALRLSRRAQYGAFTSTCERGVYQFSKRSGADRLF